jgi:thermitase
MTKCKTYSLNATSLTSCVALLFLFAFATEDSALATSRSRPQAGQETPSTPAPGANQPGTTPRVRILVQPKNTIAEDQLQNVFASVDAKQEDIIQQINVRILSVPETVRDRILDALSHRPDIEFAEPDSLIAPDLVPNDFNYISEWHLPKIQAPQAWDLTTGSSSVIIAILDTGVDGTHPDLASKLVPGWNFYDNTSDTSDVVGHGTAVAGSAAALSNNSIGVASIAWGCKIMPIRVSDSLGYGSILAMAQGLIWAADHGARVANISYKVTTSSTVTSAAQYFQSKSGVVTISAGNDGTFDSSPDNPYVLTVSATDSTDLLASFSCTGANIDLAAPGVGVSTIIAGGAYGAGTGTSFSAPVVAGVAALVISMNPGLTGVQVQDILKQTADDLGSAGWDANYGYGRVNAYKAVFLATGTPPADSTAPSAIITAPAAGDTVAGVVSIDVSATDNLGVTKLECYANGMLMGTSSSAIASFLWDTTQNLNGSYNLQIIAYDAAGNFGTSASIIVTIQNTIPDTILPSVQITSPATGTTVTKNCKVSVAASDNVAVTRVNLYVDGKSISSTTTSPYVFTCNISKLARGQHTLQAFAFDAAGNIGSSMTVSVTK